MKGELGLVLTTAEVTALADFVADQPSKVRTYRIVRDSKGVLHVMNPDGRLYRLSPLVVSR